MPVGRIARIFPDRGFGFIAPFQQGKDLYFHATSIFGPEELCRGMNRSW